jgi:hypothetical protein
MHCGVDVAINLAPRRIRDGRIFSFILILDHGTKRKKNKRQVSLYEPIPRIQTCERGHHSCCTMDIEAIKEIGMRDLD